MAVAVGGVVFNVALNATGVVQGAHTVTQNLSNVQNIFIKTAKEADKTNDSLKDLSAGLGALAGLIGAAFAGDAIKEYTLLAARVESLGTVLNNVGSIAGKNAAQLSILEDQVKALGITTQAARQSIVLLAQSELELEKSTKLARIAQDAAVIAGTNSSEAFERLVLAVQRGDSRLLRNLGIVINLAQVYQDYAVSVQRTVNTLTPLEKRQLIYNEVLKKGNLIAGTYEASLNDVNKQYASLARFQEEAQREIGNNFLPVFRQLITAATDLAKAIGDNKNYSRLTADLLSAAAAMGTLAAAAATLRLGLVALGTAAGPVGLAAVAVGALVFALQDLAGATEQSKISMDEARLAGQRYTQQQTDAAAATERLKKILLIPVGERTAEDLSKIRNEIELIGNAFPTLERGLNGALANGKLEEAISSVPDDLTNLTERQAQLNYQVEEFSKIISEEYGLNLDRVREEVKKTIKEEKSLSKAASDVESELRVAATFAGLGIDKKRQDQLWERTNQVRILGENINTLIGIVEQLERTDADKVFATLSPGAKNLEEAASEAEKQMKLVATERRKLFKETNVEILTDFQDFVSKQKALTLLSKEQIEQFVTASISREVIEANNQQAQALEGVTDAVKRQAIQLKFKDRIESIQLSKGARIKELLDDLAKSQEGLGAAVALANLQLDQQAEKIADLELEVQGLESGLDVDIVRAQKRFERDLRSNALAVKEYNTEIAKLQEGLKKALGSNDEVEIDRLTKQLDVATRGLGYTIEEQQLKERRLVAETFNLRREKLEQYTQRERALTQEIAELRETTALNVLESVERLAEAQKNAREEVAKFIQTSRLGLVDPSGNVTKYLNFVEQFQDNIAKARPDQLNLIKKIFPQAERAVLRDITRAFEDIDKRTRRFSEDYEERVAGINIEAENIRKNKMMEGATFERSNFAAEKFRQRAFEDLERERQLNEEAAAANVTAKQELAGQKNSENNTLNALLTNRKQVLEREAELGLEEQKVQQRLLELKSEKVAKAQEELGFVQQQTAELQKQVDITNQLVANSAAKTSATGKPRAPGAKLFAQPVPIEEFKGVALQEIEARKKVQDDLLRTKEGDQPFKAMLAKMESVDGHLLTIAEKIGGNPANSAGILANQAGLAETDEKILAGAIQNAQSVSKIREIIDRNKKAAEDAWGSKARSGGR